MKTDLYFRTRRKCVWVWGWVGYGDVGPQASPSYFGDYSDGLATDVSYQNKSEEERKKERRKEASYSVCLNQLSQAERNPLQQQKEQIRLPGNRDHAAEFVIFIRGHFSRRGSKLVVTFTVRRLFRQTNILIVFPFSKFWKLNQDSAFIVSLTLFDGKFVENQNCYVFEGSSLLGIQLLEI